MYKKALYVLMAALMAFVVSCNNDASAPAGKTASGVKDDSPVLAVVNGEGITLNDFKREAAKLSPSTVQLLADAGNRDLLLDRLITRRLLVQAGNEEGLDRDPKVVAHVNRIRDDKVMSLYVKEQVFDKADVGEAEVRDYFEKHMDSLGSVRLSHILVGSEDDADQVLVKYKNGESFNSLARKMSIDKSTASKGGDLGFVTWAKLSDSPQLRDEAFSLEPGSISSVVITPYGYHVLKVTDKKPATDADYEDIKAPLKDYLLQTKEKDLYDARVNALKAAAEIKRNDKSIDELSFLNLSELAAPTDAAE